MPIDSLAATDQLTDVAIRARQLGAEIFSLSDDMIVSRSAILNSVAVIDSFALTDFFRRDITLGNLPADICIEHGIENQ